MTFNNTSGGFETEKLAALLKTRISLRVIHLTFAYFADICAYLLTT